MLEAELVWLTSDGYANLRMVFRNTRFDVFSSTQLKERLRKKAAIQYNKDKEFGEEC